MKKLASILFLSASMMLASCGDLIGMDPSLASPSAAEEGTDTSLSSDGAQYGSNASEGTGQGSFSYVVDERWGEEIIAEMERYIDYVIPYYDGFIGEISIVTYPADDVGNAGYYVYDSTTTNHIDNSNYGQVLIDNGFIEEYSELLEETFYYLELNEDGTEFIGVSYGYDDYDPDWPDYPAGNYIYVYYADLSDEGGSDWSGDLPSTDGWSDEIKIEMHALIGLLLPYYDGFDGEIYYYGWEAYGDEPAGMYIYDQTANNTIDDSNYGALLVASGFTECEDELGIYYAMIVNDAGDMVTVEFYYDPGSEDFEPGNTIEITYYTSDTEEDDDGNSDFPVGPVEPLAGNVISFADASYLIDAPTADMAVWGVGTNVFTLEKGSSTLAVGGENPEEFLVNPLRIYANQVATFTFEGDVPASIVIDFDTSKGKTANVTAGDGFVISRTSNQVILTPQASGSYTLGFTAQVRLTSITFAD